MNKIQKYKIKSICSADGWKASFNYNKEHLALACWAVLEDERGITSIHGMLPDINDEFITAEFYYLFDGYIEPS